MDTARLSLSLRLLHSCQLFALVCQLSLPCLTACVPPLPYSVNTSRVPCALCLSSQQALFVPIKTDVEGRYHSEGECRRDETYPDLCLSCPAGVLGYVVRSQFFSD